jgi:hypothetical protein
LFFTHELWFSFFFKNKIYLFILAAFGLGCSAWNLHGSMQDLLVVACVIFLLACGIFVVACGIFSGGMRDLFNCSV